ncbi:MAG: ferredoxin domain-containing protein [Thermosulfidibacteraceae bacterium]|jgi:uncharacterized ferredoxin-like protein
MKIFEIIGGLALVSAITAPKSKGQNFIKTNLITEREVIEKLGNRMIEYGKEKGDPFFIRDGNSILKSDGIIFVGIKEWEPLGLNCGGCGFDGCITMKDMKKLRDFEAPICMFRLLDLGIALGSIVKTLSIHNVDNRIMYRAGIIAKEMNLVDLNVLMAIPFSISGKNIYFDREIPKV